jgi:DNA-binding NarL/FixJ family response regulator
VVKIRVGLAEAHQQMASIVCLILSEESEEFEVVGTAENGKQAINAVLTLSPDALVIDMWMPILNGRTGS